DGDRLDRRLRFGRSAFLFADVRQALAQFADFSAGSGLGQCGGGGLGIRAGTVEFGLPRFERLLRRGEVGVAILLGGYELIERFLGRLHRLLGSGRFGDEGEPADRKSTRLNSSHVSISYAVFCLKKK